MQYQFDGERERRAEFAMPKRTKQMGGIEQRLRIFVNMEEAAAEQKSWRLWSGNIMSLRGRGCF